MANALLREYCNGCIIVVEDLALVLLLLRYYCDDGVVIVALFWLWYCFCCSILVVTFLHRQYCICVVLLLLLCLWGDINVATLCWQWYSGIFVGRTHFIVDEMWWLKDCCVWWGGVVVTVLLLCYCCCGWMLVLVMQSSVDGIVAGLIFLWQHASDIVAIILLIQSCGDVLGQWSPSLHFKMPFLPSCDIFVSFVYFHSFECFNVMY